MQCFKLVNGGFVDKVIVFDELPERLMQGIKTRAVVGFPRAWAKWLESIGSLRPVFKTEQIRNPDSSISFKYTPIGKEPCFFILDYQDINADKDKWREISEYIRMNVGTEVRLKEKLEDMAISLAPTITAPLEVEPEDVPVLRVPRETKQEISNESLVKQDEVILANEPKKRGRPKQVSVEAYRG